MDIGGHSMIRSAVKNYPRVFSLTDPNQYDNFINFLSNPHNEYNYKKELAIQSLTYLREYDETILESFNTNKLKHGLNNNDKPSSVIHSPSRNIVTLNGKPSYINYLDALYSYNLVLDISNDIQFPTFASFKHNSPAGVAIGSTPQEAFFRARNADPKSSFGDFLACNMIIDKETALLISKEVSDGIIAPKYTEEALNILQKKKKGKYLILQAEYNKPWKNDEQVRQMFGTTLYQTRSNQQLDKKLINNLNCENYKSAIIAFHTAKYTQSNSVVIASEGVACGIGAGQQNRVDCIEIAGKKSQEWLSRQSYPTEELVLVSDGFLPFKDNIETAHKYNVETILQPGGSIRDKEIIESAKEKNIEMIITNERLFLH